MDTRVSSVGEFRAMIARDAHDRLTDAGRPRTIFCNADQGPTSAAIGAAARARGNMTRISCSPGATRAIACALVAATIVAERAAGGVLVSENFEKYIFTPPL